MFVLRSNLSTSTNLKGDPQRLLSLSAFWYLGLALGVGLPSQLTWLFPLSILNIEYANPCILIGALISTGMSLISIFFISTFFERIPIQDENADEGTLLV